MAAKPRCWLQFRLRTQLCFVTLVTACLAGWRYREEFRVAAERREGLAEEIVAYGGKVIVADESSGASGVRPWAPGEPLGDVVEVSVKYAEPEVRPFNHYRGGECRGSRGEVRFVNPPPRPNVAKLAHFPELKRLKID